MTTTTKDYLKKLIKSYNYAVNNNKSITTQNKLEKQIKSYVKNNK